MEKPVGSDWDFTDAGWILPYGAVMFAMLLGDFAWASGILVSGNLILAAHIGYEVRNNLPKKDHSLWYLYIAVAFILSMILTEFAMALLAFVAYATFAGVIKRGVQKERIRKKYYQDRVKTYTRMGIMIFATLCVYEARQIAIQDEGKAAREQRLIERGVIDRSQAQYNK